MAAGEVPRTAGSQRVAVDVELSRRRLEVLALVQERPHAVHEARGPRPGALVLAAQRFQCGVDEACHRRAVEDPLEQGARGELVGMAVGVGLGNGTGRAVDRRGQLGSVPGGRRARPHVINIAGVQPLGERAADPGIYVEVDDDQAFRQRADHQSLLQRGVVDDLGEGAQRDAFVSSPRPMETIASAVRRRTREGGSVRCRR